VQSAAGMIYVRILAGKIIMLDKLRLKGKRWYDFQAKSPLHEFWQDICCHKNHVAG
jgi:hypothetical protein